MDIWDLNDIHRQEDSEYLLSKLGEKAEEIGFYREKISSKFDPATFIKALEKTQEIGILSSRLSARAQMKLCECMTDSKANSENDIISMKCAKAQNETLFIPLWIKTISEKDFNRVIAESGRYSYYLHRLRAVKDHMLCENEERIINLKDLTGSEAIIRVYETLTSRYMFEYGGEKLNISQANKLKMSGKRDDRIAGHELVLERFRLDRPILGQIYRDIVNDWVTEAIELRGYQSPMGARNISNDISDESVESMLSCIRKRWDVFGEYFLLKSRILGLKDFDRYDIYAPHGANGASYGYEESKKAVLKAYEDLDREMGELAKGIFIKKHVHSKTVADKQQGAFCMSYAPGATPYILLNHQGGIDDLFTMMHEVGHGIHSLLAKDNPYFTFCAPLPMAETASIFGELFLAQSLMNDGVENEVPVLLRILDSQYAQIARQAHFTMFEQYAHRRIPEGASIEDLDREYLLGLKKHLGGIDVPESFRSEWLCISHIYSSPFYCYSYCFASLSVLCLYSMHERGDPDFLDKYKAMLRMGGSASPSDIMGVMDLDISSKRFWMTGFDFLKSLLKRLKEHA